MKRVSQQQPVAKDKAIATSIPRQLLGNHSFDASQYIEQQIIAESINMEETLDYEKNLFLLFEQLTVQVIAVSEDIEKDISELQSAALDTETILMDEVALHNKALVEVGEAVGQVISNFERASEGALRIGGRLNIAEKERLRIESTIKIIGLIQAFESPTAYANVKSMSSNQLRKSLPGGMNTDDWGAISQKLHDLRKIVTDINSKDVQMAQKNIIAISEVVETELLGEFDLSLEKLMESPDDTNIIATTRKLAEWLHLFNGGQSLQTQYIFRVVQNRIPNYFIYNKSNNIGSAWNNLGKAITSMVTRRGAGNDGDDSSDGASLNDASSDGASLSANKELPANSKGLAGFASPANIFASVGGALGGAGGNSAAGSTSLIDNLSSLFSMINNVCQEQFDIIRKVFPANTVARTTRSLVQRVFNDPAFGIQHRVDEVLRPTNRPPLPLPEYLDALLTIREKLSALYLLLLECSSHPSMRGMGSHSAATHRAQRFSVRGRLNGKASLVGNGASGPGDDLDGDGTPSSPSAIMMMLSAGQQEEEAEQEAEERMRSDAEIEEFFQDQISQVLVNYVGDYFDKENMHVRNQYLKLIQQAVEDSSLYAVATDSSGGGNEKHSYFRAAPQPTGNQYMSFPKLKQEKLKTMAQIVKTVANKPFLNAIFSVTADAVQRMESIGRDDKVLPSRLKDMFILELLFLSQGLMLPWSMACVSMLSKLTSSRSSGATLPPMDFLALLSALSYLAYKLRTHFNSVFAKPLSTTPNTLAVCREHSKKVFKAMAATLTEQLQAWTLCIIIHVDKLLYNLQSRYDYCPKDDYLQKMQLPNQMQNPFKDPDGNLNTPTAACIAACGAIAEVASAVRAQKSSIAALDMTRLFWIPLGQQFMATLISHLRKQRVSEEGMRRLMRDLDEYYKVIVLLQCPETVDMILCLRHLCTLFSADEQELIRLVTEDFRYMDTNIVLCMCRMRADWINKPPPGHWVHELNHLFPDYKWDSPLPWEQKKSLHLNLLAQYSSSKNKTALSGLQELGPSTLRKTSALMSPLFLAEIARLHLNSNNNTMASHSRGTTNATTRSALAEASSPRTNNKDNSAARLQQQISTATTKQSSTTATTTNTTTTTSTGTSSVGSNNATAAVGKQSSSSNPAAVPSATQASTAISGIENMFSKIFGMKKK